MSIQSKPKNSINWVLLDRQWTDVFLLLTWMCDQINLSFITVIQVLLLWQWKVILREISHSGITQPEYSIYSCIVMSIVNKGLQFHVKVLRKRVVRFTRCMVETVYLRHQKVDYSSLLSKLMWNILQKQRIKNNLQNLVCLIQTSIT